MKIGINGERILISNPAGPELYTIRLIRALAKVDSENEYTIYLNQSPEKDFIRKLTFDKPNFKLKILKKVLSWTQVSLAFELFLHPIDVFFTPVHTVSILRPLALKVVGMIHGLEYTYVSKFHKFPYKLLAGKHERYVCKVSASIIVPSLATKQAIITKWPEMETKTISVIPEGVDENFYKRSAEEILQIRDKYKINKHPYLLFVSTIQPRKNLPVIIKALSFALKTKPNIKLVIAGKLGWDYTESLNAPKKYNVSENVIWAGRVDEKDLPSLFSGALAYVSSSLEEGFGLPLLEAMACGTPCIVSNISSYKSIGQNAPIYTDPSDPEKLAKEIVNLNVSQEILNEGIKLSKKYSWEKTAIQVLNNIGNVVNHW